ncbi:MAG: acetate/propionate family kinase [Solirubrobacteraceae bacterium]
MPVLTVNAGSSTVKLGLVGDDDDLLASSELRLREARIDRDELESAITGPFASAEAVAHRIVHGGDRFRDAVVIDDEVVRALRQLTDLAPLHQPKSLAALDAVSSMFPRLPAVACFDTGFHATLPPAAFTYPIPAQWREHWGLRRYGFHGLSHSWIAKRTPELLEAAAEQLRIVSCHLGAGASLCAIRGGESIDTTMGFTPLEGVVMATRSGSVDPGMLLWLLARDAISELEMSAALEHESGLKGLAGEAAMEVVLARADAGDEQATVALDVYVHRLRAGIAGMAAAMGGLDVLVFTAGVGEHAPEVRARAAEGLRFLGVEIDEWRNRDEAPDCEISGAGAAVKTLVLRAREDLEMAREARAALAQ